MNRAEPFARSRPGDAAATPAGAVRWILFALFLASFALVFANTLFSILSPAAGDVLIAALILLGTATTLVALSQQLPAQNVLLAAAIIAAIGGGAHLAGAMIGIPFGEVVYFDDAGPKLFNSLPWPLPFIWIIAILNSRGVARMILRPWRKTRAYGFRLIGLTAILTLLFDFGLEPFATQVHHFWFWTPSKIPVTWHSAPVSNFVGWAAASLLILAFVTPPLIKKKPVKTPPDYQPLMVWVLLNLLFAGGAATQQLWSAAGFSAAAIVIATVFALRGARW